MRSSHRPRVPSPRLFARPTLSAGAAMLLLGLLVALGAVPAPAHAGARTLLDDPASGQAYAAAAAESGVFDVVEVSGYLDPIMADFIERSIHTASERGSLGLVLQLDSSRAVVDDERIRELASLIRASEVPVSMWIAALGRGRQGRGRPTGRRGQRPCPGSGIQAGRPRPVDPARAAPQRALRRRLPADAPAHLGLSGGHRLGPGPGGSDAAVLCDRPARFRD